jgi:ABC-type glycerol-3-phosphate transport system substrate-binding protein
VRRLYLSAGLVLAIAVLATAAYGATAHRSSSNTTSAVSGSITFDGVWSAGEAAAFGDVIKAFNKTTPKVKVNYKSLGDNLPTILATSVAGGRPPDMADIAQPGLIQQFANKGALKPISYAKGTMAANFAPSWLKLGTFNGKLYGLVFKASNKSTVWYNAHAFKNAGVSAPATFTKLIKDAGTIRSSGVPPFSIGGSDGWTLTDLFENIYLRQAGVAKYNALSAHKVKWTDASVGAALRTMAQIVGNSANMAGGTSGAVQTQFPDSVNNVFQTPPKAAIVIEGDFVPGVATVKAKPKIDYGEFPFPSINGSGPAVEIGGDTIVAFKDNPAIEAFVKFLASPQAAAAWAKHGGFATGNRHMSASVYPDAITRATAGAVAKAKNVVFDMSDEQPGSFGATVGQGEWGLFQNFLRNPKDVSGIQKKLEASAAAAYKKGK